MIGFDISEKKIIGRRSSLPNDCIAVNNNIAHMNAGIQIYQYGYCYAYHPFIIRVVIICSA